jgi:ABC-2 type transport system permease protein
MRASSGIAGRLLRLWRIQAYLDFMFMTRDAKSFFSYSISDIVLSLAAIVTTILLAQQFDGIGGWSIDQISFMLGFAVVVYGLHDCCFGYNIKFISRRIGRGQLDHLLIQPQPLWMVMLTDGFLPFSGSGSLLVGLGYLGWAIAKLGIALTPWWVLAMVLNITAAAAIGIAFSFIWSSLAFWAPNSAEEVSSSANRLLSRLYGFPLDGLSVGVQGILLTAIPAGFIAWYPSRALLGLAPSPASVVVTPLAAVVFSLSAAWLFRVGLAHYGVTGSQRYSAFGHRR